MPHSSPQAIDILVIIGVTLGLGLMLSWASIWALGYVTGWRKLSAEFPGREPLAGAASAFGSIGFYALGNYNNCVRFRTDEECLHFWLVQPFRGTHPPLSIPWAAVEIVDAKPGWGGLCRIKVSGVPIRVPKKVIEREVGLRKELDALKGTTPV